MKFLLFITLFSPAFGQTLFDLAPNRPVNDSLTPTHTASLKIGYHSPPKTTRKFYFFGDSLTDTGNLGRLIGGLGAGYPGFTLSNGPTWPTYLAPSVLGFSEIEANPALDSLSRSVDFAVALSTTSTIDFAQTGEPFRDFLPNLNITPNDLAFIWGGANDFLPLTRQIPAASPEQIANTIDTGTTNLTSSVTNLKDQGIQNFAVISLIDLSLAPGVSGFNGAAIARQVNASLKQKLAQLPVKPNLLWIDANSFLNDTVANPAAYGLTNVTESLAFNAGDGIPSTIPPEDQAGYLFYDDIHPSTRVHQQFATFVASHLRLEKDATDAFLVTDAALTLDDRSGFESHGLSHSQSDFSFTNTTFESHRRSTQAFRADLDYALTDQVIIGAEGFYSDG